MSEISQEELAAVWYDETFQSNFRAAVLGVTQDLPDEKCRTVIAAMIIATLEAAAKARKDNA